MFVYVSMKNSKLNEKNLTSNKYKYLRLQTAVFMSRLAEALSPCVVGIEDHKWLKLNKKIKRWILTSFLRGFNWLKYFQHLCSEMQKIN